MVASCSYYGPTRKAFDWLTEIKDENNFGFGLITAVQSDPETPTKFNNAWDHKNQEQCKLWRKAVRKELNNMSKRNVWNIVLMIGVPEGSKPICSKWGFKNKKGQ